MITVLHRGGYAQMITILHRGEGSLGTPKSDYVICAQPHIQFVCNAAVQAHFKSEKNPNFKQHTNMTFLFNQTDPLLQCINALIVK